MPFCMCESPCEELSHIENGMLHRMSMREIFSPQIAQERRLINLVSQAEKNGPKLRRRTWYRHIFRNHCLGAPFWSTGRGRAGTAEKETVVLDRVLIAPPIELVGRSGAAPGGLRASQPETPRGAAAVRANLTAWTCLRALCPPPAQAASSCRQARTCRRCRCTMPSSSGTFGIPSPQRVMCRPRA